MFVKAVSAISPQKTHNLDFEKGDFQVHEGLKFNAFEPHYLDFIPAGLLRRMGKAVRMGIGASMSLIKDYPKFDGIILSTANGGLEDCVKFLNQIVDYQEGVLTPTNFVQSTPNAVAGQLALMTKTNQYNNTHVNGSLAFENALVDAQMVMESHDSNTIILLGAVEEISDYQFNIDQLSHRFKTEHLTNYTLFDSKSPGSICGEGATMFVLSSEPKNARAEIVDVAQITYPTKDSLSIVVDAFLQKNKLTNSDIDVLITGKNGDSRTDHWYDFVKYNSFSQADEIHFKHFVGEYRTASAFGVYLAVQILSEKISQATIKISKKPKFVLVYNHFDGIRHGFVLLKSVLI